MRERSRISGQFANLRKFAIVILLAACATPADLTPAVGPGTQYPCGVDGLVCPGKMCCSENEVCGGTPLSGCPAGECCFVGSGDFGAKRPPRKQRPQ